jgi:NAD(P)-dependent dehydrogenase (short-subunit alcohol dehydrogenase family)
VKLEGRIAIVTGAGRNIGEAIAHAFAAEGARVAVVDLDPNAARAVAAAINAEHPEHALAVTADVSASADVQRMLAETLARWDGVDILVNNVAITDRKTIFDLDEAEWDRVIDVSLKSQFLCTKYVAQQMARQGRGGRVINIASTSGHRGRKDATAYSAAKAGVLNLSRSLALQLAPYNIRVNSVTPNRIGSPVGEAEVRTTGQVRNLVGRVGVPRDIAAMVTFLASPDGDFITGADLLVDGGALGVGGP